jgi:hypothetical protein
MLNTTESTINQHVEAIARSGFSIMENVIDGTFLVK